jgi:Zn-dependent protease/CBS domain-containing protein
MANRTLGSGLTVARLFGIKVRVHVTWLIIVALLTYTLAEFVLPLSSLSETGWWGEGLQVQARMDEYARNHPGVPEAAVRKRFGVQPWPEWQYWALGLIGALGLFVCVLAHELSHSLVAKREGIPVEGITLFIFGGVSQIGGEAETPDVEFKVAAAGPLMSLALGAGCGAMYLVGRSFLPGQALALLFYFAFINLMLMTFNLVPGFPLDGGRLLRAALWKIIGNFRQATFVASIFGRVVAGGLIFTALMVALVSRDLLGGFWLALIGLFLWQAAKASYEQVRLREALKGLTARDAMTEDPTAVGPDLSLDRLVPEYFYKYRRQSFPVMDEDGQVRGTVRLSDVRSLPKSEWEHRTVRDAMQPLGETTTVAADEDLGDVFRKLTQADGAYLPVVADDGTLEGVVTQHDLMNLLTIRSELGEGDA